MSEETHTQKVIELPNGKKKVVYVRTEKTEQDLEKIRLGNLFSKPLLTDSKIVDRINLPFLVIITSQEMALRITRTRLERNKKPHRVLTGTQVLDHYLNNTGYLEAFSNSPQLFILFSYLESANRRLGELINELISNRNLIGKDCWLFLPKSIPEIAAQWGQGLHNLKQFPCLDLGIDVSSPASNAVNDFSPKDSRIRAASNPVEEAVDGKEDLRFQKKTKRRRP